MGIRRRERTASGFIYIFSIWIKRYSRGQDLVLPAKLSPRFSAGRFNCHVVLSPFSVSGV
jgi:hypothetical protein